MQAIRCILVANRGEIARRVMRSAQRLGIRTVAVFSDADADLPHVRQADSAVRIGPAPSTESYLSIERLIDVAKKNNADALHPGYGFLAENANLATACEKNGITFIGPPSTVIAAMGSKLEAKRLMQTAGIPVVPGYADANQDLAKLEQEAKKIGFPLLIKASGGGGGKGMKLVSSASELKNMLASAKREATSAFGDDTLILEKYIAASRHVEVQILADTQGNVVHLFDRDCSAQRRHQKIIEEAPAPNLKTTQRKAILDAAVLCASTIGYRSAGTVEFILAPNGAFYFLEVNTRIQVEHPVTELITGIDIVEEQIHIAQGQALSLKQAAIKTSGVSVEARLYAEDASVGFLPQTGRILDWQMPVIEGIRCEESYAQGNEVGIHYDPMLAKIIAAGATRDEALRKLDYALRNTSVLGLTTNREFLLEILNDSAFQKAEHSTDLVDRILKNPQRSLSSDAPLHRAAVAATLARICARVKQSEGLASRLRGWRNTPKRWQLDEYIYKDKHVRVEYLLVNSNTLRLRNADSEQTARIVDWEDPSLIFELDSLIEKTRVSFAQENIFVHFQAADFCLQVVPRFPDRRLDKEHAKGCLAPMPGKVVKICVNEGQTIAQGQELIVLEAMKMEQTLTAIRSGRAGRIRVALGQQVQAQDLLVELEIE